MKKLLILLVALAVGLVGLVGAAAGAGKDDPDALRKPPRDNDGTAQQDRPAGQQAHRCYEEPIGQRTYRMYGENRYETAAQISACQGWTFENTRVVYLANGETFPDALALGPSTEDDGPLLLVQRHTLPSATRWELDELRPCEILAVGGSAVISRSVLQQADAYTVDCD